jgi:hypothetical protein
MQSREPDGNDIAYVIAAGRANHAGEGGWHGLSGNSSVYGLEIEHTGTEPLPEGRQRIAAAIHAGMFGGDVGMIAQHYEWAGGRKIDAAENCDGDTFRGYVAEARSGGRGPQPEEDEMMFIVLEPNDGRPFAAGAPGYWSEINGEQAQLLADLKLANYPWTKCNGRQYDVAQELFSRGGPAAVWATLLAPNLVDGQRYSAGDTLLYTHAEAHNAAGEDAPEIGK